MSIALFEPTTEELDAWTEALNRAVVSLQELREPPHKAFSDPHDERFWITRYGRGGWWVDGPNSWGVQPVVAERYEDAVAIVALGVDTDKTTYLAVVGQLVLAGRVRLP